MEKGLLCFLQGHASPLEVTLQEFSLVSREGRVNVTGAGGGAGGGCLSRDFSVGLYRSKSFRKQNRTKIRARRSVITANRI